MPAASPLTAVLAHVREMRGLTQEELAEAASVGVDTISRIERGRRSTVRPDTISKLARALRVPEEMLRGVQPPSNAYPNLRELRRAITATDEIPGLADFVENTEVASLDQLALSAHDAWRQYVDGRHDHLLDDLPNLLVDARRFVHASRGDNKAAGQRILSTAYRLGAGLAGRFQLDDLAWISADRALKSARHSDNPDVQTAISLRYLAWTLVRQGRNDQAEQIAVRAAEHIEPRAPRRDPIRAAVFGNLLFNGAAAAVRSGNGERAADLMGSAQAAAEQSGRDTASEAAIFGPRVTAIQAVENAWRLGDPETALRLAEDVPGSADKVPPFWEAGHHLHVAAAATELRRDRQALVHLSQACALAPDWVRHQPVGARTAWTLVDRAPHHRAKVYTELAAHFGTALT
jgi:transcriptional regulator with XRE-family HTH domain